MNALNDPLARSPRNAWLLLLAVSAASFVTAEYLGERHLAVAAILGIAALKVLVVLFRFMELAVAPKPVRVFFLAWTSTCAVVPFVLWWIASA